MLDDIGSIIGMISGLIAIYSFVTGTTSLNNDKKILKLDRKKTDKISRIGPFPSWIYIFFPALLVTLGMGLDGDDSAGIMFWLLIISGISIILYQKKLHQSQSLFILANVILLPLLGFFFGGITRGEEGIGLIMGIISGIGIGLIALNQGKFSQIIHKESSIFTDRKNDNAQQKQIQTDEDPVVILKMRLAKGEINKDEYAEILKELETH